MSDEVTEIGEVHHLARLVMDQEVDGLVEWELVGWNQCMEGGVMSGSSTIVVKVHTEGWSGVIYKCVMWGCM